MAVLILPAVATMTTTATLLDASSISFLHCSSPLGAPSLPVRSCRSRGSGTRWEGKSRGGGGVVQVFGQSRVGNWDRKEGAGMKLRSGGIGGSQWKEKNWQSNASVGGTVEEVTGGGDGSGSGSGVGGGGGAGGRGDGTGGGDDGSSGEESGGKENREASIAVLASVGKSLESLPGYLAAAVKDGKIPPAVLERFLELEKAPFRNWLMQFGGFRERLLADDLFLTKVGIECGVGLFTKTAAEYERRRENFTKELDFVIADVIMALIADFMLVWLPAPTVSLRPALAKNAGAIAKYFASCPDNAFQVALRGTSYSTLQRLGAIGRNGAKLLVVGTTASLLGTAATNALIKIRQTVDKDSVGEAEDVPILETSLAYGVYMAVSSNLRYQILAGVVEQRVLEPLLGRRKLALSASSFVVRTGNTFLGSLLWVDYARWVGVQKSNE